MAGRRDVIKVGLAALAGTQIATAWGADKAKEKAPRPAAAGPLMTRPVPSTGERLAAIGVGTSRNGIRRPQRLRSRSDL